MKIINSKLAALSGWGTGIAVLYSIFNREIQWSEGAALVLDLVLSVSVATLFSLALIAISAAISKSREEFEKSYSLSDRSIFRPLIVTLIFIGAGLFFGVYAPQKYGETKSAATIGAINFSNGIIYLYFCIIARQTRR